ncbi:cytochrome P450 monooxygenase-like protein [Zopfia rhizophila CBS 207.26]|uniref:Cytochrome P450 monooxygenase-like protein n=1 Tax=Zopfia rhizophila CBS 207.26 TaxID=1314779 RepID=A0A6A6DLW0_9PEZI|nr:cytochrome P450 monooxygenase-like protein [Zopfia rhizophila CBS 207.26]
MALLILYAIAIALGVAAHNGIFINGEWHLRVPQILLGHIILFYTFWLLVSYTQNDEKKHHSVCIRMFGSYLGSLFSSILIYRLFFHRLKRFPGPRLAAATKFWHVWESRNSTNYLVMQKVHQNYGTFVRTGPNEISIFQPNGHELLDGAKNENIRDVWYDVVYPRTSLVFNRDNEEHRDRKSAWSQAVSAKSMREYEPRILQLVGDVADCIGSYASKPVKMNDVMSWFSFDSMGEFAFGKDFGMIRAKKTQPVVQQQRRALKMLTPINDVIWVARTGFTFFPFLGGVRDWLNVAKFCDEKTDKVDMSKYFIEEYHRLRGEKSLKYRENVLVGNAISAVVAGSDTTRAALISIWWFLAKYPEHAEKIVSEVKDSDMESNALASMPHLNGVINQTLRLIPPALTGGSGITGPNGLWVDDVWIPAHTKVTAPKYVLHRLPSAFVKPEEFIPERWYSRPELIIDRRAFSPFSVGARQCIGKAISLLELRLTVAVILKRFKVQFPVDYDPATMIDDLTDEVTAQPGDLLMEVIFGSWKYS